MEAGMRILLDETVSREQMHELAMAEGWDLVNVVDRDDEANVPFEIVWSDGEGTVHYLEDHLVGRRYVVVRGSPGLREAVRSAVPTIDLDTALADFQKADAPVDVAASIERIAITAGSEPDARVVDAFASALLASESAVRNRAIYASGYVGWGDLLPLLRRLAQTDDDDDVRSSASLMVQALQTSVEGRNR